MRRQPRHRTRAARAQGSQPRSAPSNSSATCVDSSFRRAWCWQRRRRFAVGRRAAAWPTPAGSRPASSARCSSAMLPTLGTSSGCRPASGQHQVLDRELRVHHAARALCFQVEAAGFHRARRRALLVQRMATMTSRFNAAVSRGAADHGSRAPPRTSRAPSVSSASTKTGPGHRLVFPGPGRVAAALLLVVPVEAWNVVISRPRVAVGTQRGVRSPNRSPSAVLVDSQLISLRTKAA